MILSLFLTTALAADRELQYGFTGPNDLVVAQETWVLPVDEQVWTVDVGGVPHRVALSIENRHDTVVVLTVVDELKGRKLKPKRVAEAKLILYEGYPGEVTHTSEVSRAYEGTPLEAFTWTLSAAWDYKAVAPPPPPVEEPAAPADEAIEEAAEEPAAP